MTKEQAYIIHLLSHAIRNTVPEKPETDISWENIREIAEEQKILPLLFEAVNKLDKEYQPPEDIMNRWKNDTLSCTFFYAIQMQYINDVLTVADKMGVDMLVLKGTVLRELYPVPELRTMGDCDILVKKEQMEQVNKVFSSCGYIIPKNSTAQLIYYKKDALKFEVFYTIPSGLKSIDGREVDIWSNTESFLGTHIVKPSVENMILHSVTHLMKHLRTRGSGIRNFADIILLLEKCEFDWEKLLQKMRELNVDKLFFGLLNAAEKYFDYKSPVEIPEVKPEFVERLMMYMLSVGVYGIMDNAYILDARSAEGNKAVRIGNYRRKILPPLSAMSDKYGYVKKYPVLLPVAWIHRMYNVVLKEKRSIGENMKSMKSATDTVNEQMEILEYFNIK